MQAQQHVSQFEVPNASDPDAANPADTLINLLCILGQAYQL